MSRYTQPSHAYNRPPQRHPGSVHVPYYHRYDSPVGGNYRPPQYDAYRHSFPENNGTPIYRPYNSNIGPSRQATPSQIYPVEESFFNTNDSKISTIHEAKSNIPRNICQGGNKPTTLSNLERTESLNSYSGAVSQTKESTKSANNADQQWVENWLRRRNIVQGDRKDSSKIISIPKAKSLLKTASNLLEELVSAKDDLQNVESHPIYQWEEKQRNVIRIQNKLKEIQNLLDTGLLKKKMEFIAKKRSRLRKQRLKKYKAYIEHDEEKKRKEKIIDDWQRSIHQKELDQKREKDMKAAADATLSEVRKKLSEARKCREILEKLTKLRQVRKDAMERMGLYTAKDTDVNFVERRDRLDTIVRKQLKTYEDEERALKVMLEAEAEESKEKMKEILMSNRHKHREKLKSAVESQLFGYQKVPDISDEIYPFWQYYTSATSNLHSFLTIRQEWDAYIVRPGSAGGSSIPLGWVIPEAPSDQTWESVLEQSQNKR